MSHSDLPALLIRNHLVSGQQILDAIAKVRATHLTWIEYLVATDAVDELRLAAMIAEDGRLQRCESSQLGAASTAARASLPADTAIEHRVMPLSIDGDGYLVVAMVDPTDTAAIAEIEFFSGRQVLREVATATALACALHHYYGAHTVLWPRPPASGSVAPSLYAAGAQQLAVG